MAGKPQILHVAGTQSGRRRQGCEDLVQTDRSVTSPCMVQYVAVVHPTALRGMCVTVPRAMAGNKAVRGMNGLSQLPAMLCRKKRTDCIE